jgi:hypothetical protein
MKKTLLLTAILGTLFFISCKKDNQTPASSSLPKTYTEDVRSSVLNNVTTYNLTYDANNRLVSLAAIPEPSITKFIYNYTSSNSFTLDLYDYNILGIHEIFWLNSFLLVDSTFQFDNSNDSSSEKYFYNTNKQLVELKNYNYYYTGAVLNLTTDYTYDNNGNATMMSDDAGNTTTYTYYTDLINTLSMGRSYFPLSRNFIKTSTLSSGGNTESSTHFYTFDSNNRLVKDSSSTTGTVDVIGIKSYTY